MAIPPLDREREHRREHARIALFLHNGSDPTNDEIDDHLEEMDRLSSDTGALHVHSFLDHEAEIRAQKRKEKEAEQANRDAVTAEEDRRRDEREQRRQERDAEAQRRIEQRQSEVQPDENLASI